MDLNKLFEEVLEDERLSLTGKGKRALKKPSLHFIPFEDVELGMKAYGHTRKGGYMYDGKVIEKIGSIKELKEFVEEEQDPDYTRFYKIVKARIAHGKKSYDQFVIVSSSMYGEFISPYAEDDYCGDDGWFATACYVKY